MRSTLPPLAEKISINPFPDCPLGTSRTEHHKMANTLPSNLTPEPFKAGSNQDPVEWLHGFEHCVKFRALLSTDRLELIPVLLRDMVQY